MRDQLDRLEREWQPFRRSLRRRHQPSFDALFERARGHADAATQQNPRDPWRALVFAALLAQERELANLRERVDELEDSVEDDGDGETVDADRHGDSDSDRTADSEQPVRSSSEPHRNRDSDRTADRDADSDADDP